MHGAVTPLPQYAFMAWCSVKKKAQRQLYLYLFKIYKIVILPVLLYGCETWSLTLREEHRLRVFEIRVLRIFGPKREEDIMEKTA
jgi:hypothetical protein